jgi:hypothetical protein
MTRQICGLFTRSATPAVRIPVLCVTGPAVNDENHIFIAINACYGTI